MNTLVLLLFRIGAFFSYVPKKLRRNNQLQNNNQEQLIAKNEYIEHQNELTSLIIGKKPVSYSGCGAIAVFNILKIFKNNPTVQDFSNIISCFEKNGLVFSGMFGISPVSIKKLLLEKGFFVKGIKSSDSNALDTFGNNFDGYISVFFNKNKNIRYGLHYIAIEKNENGFESHNPNKTGSTLSEVIFNASYNIGTPLYTIGISERI